MDSKADTISQTIVSPPYKMNLELPVEDEQIAQLRAGDWVTLRGSIYLLGLRASQRLIEELRDGKEAPFELTGQTIYHTHPTSTPMGKVIGNIGPALVNTFDPISNDLLDSGVRCLIGRGPRQANVITKLKRSRGLYLVTVGGALLARCVLQSEVIAYPELGAEAIRRIKVKRFPALVAVDGFGRDIYERESNHRFTPPPPSKEISEEKD